ncbi:MAG: AAA family ATPase [bacterium]|nr:AAA family ATPase [bacterium]
MSQQLADFARTLEPHTLDTVPGPHSPTPWICVAGAKGGVGKTTIAVNLAVQLAKSGYRVLLADLDPGCGDVGVHLRLASERTVDDAAMGRCLLREALVPGPAGTAVLLGQIGSTALADEPTMSSLLEQLTDVATSFDVVIADTGAGITQATMRVAERADVVLAVTTPDVAAMTDTYALTKVLQPRRAAPPRLVVNRATSYEEAARAAGKLGAVTDRFLGTRAPLTAKIARDGQLERSLAEQRPLSIAGSGAAFDDLRALCAAVLAELPDTRRRRLPQQPTHRLRPTAG